MATPSMTNYSAVENSTLIAESANSTSRGLLLYYTKPQWALTIEFVLMVIVLVFGVPGNALIITVQYKNKNRTSTDFLVMVMACYEMFGSLVNTIMRMFIDIDSLWTLVSSTFVCKFTPFSYFLAQYGSGQTLCALAVDRCVKTIFPFSRWYNERFAKLMSACIFVFTFAFTSPQYIFVLWDPVSQKCALDLSKVQLIKWFGIAGSFMMLGIFCILALSYLLIAVSLRRRHLKKIKRRQNQPQIIQDIPSSNFVEDHSTCVTEISVSIQSRTQEATNGHSSVTSAQVKPMTEEKENAGNKSRSRMLTLEGRNVNKLTGLMFLLTLIYVASYLILWYLFITTPIALGAGALQLALSIPMLNCISNPIMFFSMSTRFRSNVKTLLFSKK